MHSYEILTKILESGTKNEKIKVLESLAKSKDFSLLRKVISKLDDSDIEVRGESFSSLVLNENDISKLLIDNLENTSKNISGFCALILANRGDSISIPYIMKLSRDDSALVRSCALGALGYMKANQAKKIIHERLSDKNLEVKKSAIKAAIDIGEKFHKNELNHLEKETDDEIIRLVIQMKKKFYLSV